VTKSDELASLDATAQAERVRRKEMTALELVDAAIERIEQLNPKLNAVIAKAYDQARAQAREALPDAPFAGVPYLLKDLLASWEGVPMVSGCSFMRDFAPDHDSELVRRLKRAGFILLGKTNVPELGQLPTTEPRLFGPTLNPWDTSKSPGGSSGGSGAAVASGMVPAAHGNDGGGSIRIPASCCGLFGLKPTRARNPLGPDFGDIMSGLVVEHALTRSVRDSAVILDGTSGPDKGDPYCAPDPARPFIEEVGADPGRLRIAFCTTTAKGIQAHPDCIAAVEDAAGLCEDLGHDVVEQAPPLNPKLMGRPLFIVSSAGCAATMEGMAQLTGRSLTREAFEPLTWALYETGCKQTAWSYLLAQDSLNQLARSLAPFFDDFDVWLTPTLGEPPLPLGSFDSPPEEPLQGLFRCGTFIPFTAICNVTGQPAMSVPLYWNEEGLPIGTQFIGRFGDEATLFRLAAQLEEARPWAGRRPPVWAGA